MKGQVHSSYITSFRKAIILLVCFLSSTLLPAVSIPQNQAVQTARGWLKHNPAPMERNIHKNSGAIQTFSEQNGRVLYYVVPLKPNGFVVISADDEIEPVIAFSQTGTYDAIEGNPLKDLLEQDMKGRLDSIKQANQRLAKSDVQNKWQTLSEAGADKQTQDEGEIQLYAGSTSISDVRVPPLLISQWGQGDASGGPCYNYYTPYNYPTGCVATAMAQLMRYHAWPTAGIGIHSFEITVDRTSYWQNTRGGNGAGGPYNWASMVYNPQAGGLTTAQRQAIGALCYDAGLSVNMDYTEEGSGASSQTADLALVNTFGYSNSIWGFVFATYVNSGLTVMMQPNLDAGMPVILSISGPNVAHAVVADGYGYNGGTLYHHLNMGWGGLDDAWYLLPPDVPSATFTIIQGCIYNVYTSGTGEIISGRITSLAGTPLEGVTVTAYQGTTQIKQTTTNSRGIYALKYLSSNTTFRISAVKGGYAFTDLNVSTGSSADFGTSSGNKWAINFAATNPTPPTALNQTVDANSLSDITIRLEALDDHLPNPPDKIRYSIMTLPAHGTLSDNTGAITTIPHLMAVDANSVQYTPCPYYGSQDSFTFKANDGGTSPSGGDSNIATITVNVDNKRYTTFAPSTNSLAGWPVETSWHDSRVEVIYLKNNIGQAQSITDLALNINTLPGQILNNWTIRLKHTLLSNFSTTNYFDNSGWTIVYQSNQTISSTGWIWFHFQTPFAYNETQNLMVDFSFNNSYYSTDGACFVSETGTERAVMSYSDSTNGNPLTWTTIQYGASAIPNIKLIGTIPITPIVGDFDLSCDVKFPDLAVFSAAWMTQQGQSDYDAACDISSPKDNIINLADLIVFANHWLQTYQP